MTVATRYNLYKSGKITKEQFLYEVRKDSSVPFITPLTSFDDALTMLKQRRIVVENFEAPIAEQSTENPYMQGFLAGEQGAEYNCPYDDESENYEMWCDGYNDGRGQEEEQGEEASLEDLYADQINDYESNIANSEMNRHDSELYMEKSKEVPNPDAGKFIIINDRKNRVVDTAFDSQQAASDYLRKNPNLHGNNVSLKIIKLGDTHKVYSTNEGVSLKEQVKEFVQKAMEGGSSMDEAKQQAKDYFSTEKAALNEAAKPKLGVDQVNPYELKKGTDYEMGYADKAAPSWAEASLMNIAGDFAKAQAKALKNLNKDPMYYTRLQANGGKKEKKEKEVKTVWDGYQLGKMAEDDKANVGTKKEGPVKTKGVKVMPDKGVTGTEKVMKEGIKTSVQKIREFVSKQLKQETQLVKSKKTGATIDVVPDAQAQQMQADLQRKGVQTTKTTV